MKSFKKEHNSAIKIRTNKYDVLQLNDFCRLDNKTYRTGKLKTDVRSRLVQERKSFLQKIDLLNSLVF